MAPTPQSAIVAENLTRSFPGVRAVDHLSFDVPARADPDQAVSLFDENSVPHGEITALPSFGIYVLPFRDSDDIQLELTAPIA